jgi:RNA polymerase sigma factor (sigma-70 family)
MIEKAVSGDKKALDELLTGVQDMVFNLSLRMLGTIADAEDATQEILIKVMTHLSSFRQESIFTTWVYRIAINHLQSYRKNLFSKMPLSFEIYGTDIACGKESDVPDLTGGVDIKLLARELKLNCANVMLQCLDSQSRCIFILGTMFRLDSSVAAQIFDLTPEAYRQRLSRIRKRMADFLSEYCGLSKSGICSCPNRVNYAIKNRRIAPDRLEYSAMQEAGYHKILACAQATERLDHLSQIFANMPAYHSPVNITNFVHSLLESKDFLAIADA